MTDLLLVEKVAEAIANFALSRMNVLELDWNEMGEERRPYFRDAATAVIAAMPGYEAGLVEGFKQGIEAAAKVADVMWSEYSKEPIDWFYGGQEASAGIASRIRTLSPPSIADEVD